MTPGTVVLPNSLERRVAEIWTTSANPTLTDGSLLSVCQIGTEVLSVTVVPYRYWYAQASHGISLGIRPLAVTGVLRVRGGFVMGLRRSDSIEDPALWEFVPSGSVDPKCALDSGAISPAAQVYIEAMEELLLSPYQLSTPTFFTCLDNETSGVVDLVYQVQVSDAAVKVPSPSGSQDLVEHEVLAVVADPWNGAFSEHCSTLTSLIASMLAVA